MKGSRKLMALTGLAIVAVLGAGCGGPEEPRLRETGQTGEYRSRAERLEEAGDLAAAHGAYRDAARRYPTQAWTWSGVGRCARRLGRFGEAREALTAAIRWDSTSVADHVALAEMALQEREWDDAARHAAAAARQGGDTAAHLALRGTALAENGHLTEARHLIDRALALAPQDPQVRIARAVCLARSDSVAVALAELNALVAALPEEPAGWAARGALRYGTGDTKGAREDGRRAVELGGDPRHRLRLARWELAAGETEAAAGHFRALLADNPRHPDALEGLGSCALAAGDPEAAEKAFADAIASDPEFAPAYLALGRFRRGEGRLDEAVSLFRKARARASREDARWEECSVALADAYVALGEPQNALDVADGMLARLPDSEAARGVRGRALAAGAEGAASGPALEQFATRPRATREERLAYSGWLLEHGDAERALQFAEAVLAESPDDPDARVARAGAYSVLGRAAEAEKELHDLLAAGHDAAGTHLALARLYLVEERLPDAIFHATEGARLDPDDPDFAVIHGLAAMQRGDMDEARAAFERERDLRPESAKAWMNLGRLELDTGRAEEAAACFRTAQSLDPAGWFASYQLGLALQQAGRPKDAVEAYRQVLAKNERVAEAHNNLAWLLADLELDPVLAEVHARRAAELSPDNAQVLGTLGWAQYKNRLFDEAAVSLKEARRLAPEDPMKHYMLGVVLADRGETAEAQHALEAALRLDPAFDRAESARRIVAGLE